MPVLPWRNDADGFAFVNSWTLDAAERAALTALAQPIVPAVIAAIVPDPIMIATLTAAASAFITFGPLPAYGLCGGLAYSALDHWIAHVPIPRGANGTDQPARTGVAPAAIRNSLWARLLDSLGPGGVLRKTIEWSLRLNQIPAFMGGGAAGIKNRTVPEWDLVRSHIDAGRPWPIGLIYNSRDIWDQHQILVYGYENTGTNQGKLFVYDCNKPSQFAVTSDPEPSMDNPSPNTRVVTLDFRGPTLVATSPSDSTGSTLAGFFCSNYFPVTPVGMSKQYGEFLKWNGDPRTWMVTDGARMPVANAAELTALGGAAASVRSTGSAFTPTNVRPRDGACFRERNAAAVFTYAGGAPFWIPDPTWMDLFGGFGRVRVVPDNTIAAFNGLPDEGTLLREWSDPKIWRIMSGVRRWVTTPSELDKWGGFPSVRVVPDRALTAIPQGQPLPPPNLTNECPTLKTKITQLTAEIAQIQATINTLDDKQLTRAAGRLQVAQHDLAAAKARSAVLNCP
jgi:hypothetical protein